MATVLSTSFARVPTPVQTAASAPRTEATTNPSDGLRASDADEAPRPDEPPKAHRRHSHKSSLFKPPRPAANRSAPPPKLTQNRSAPVRSRQSRSVGAPTSPEVDIGVANADTDPGEIDDEDDQRRLRLAFSLRTNKSSQGESKHSSTDEGGHWERHFTTIRMAKMAATLPSKASPALEQALGAHAGARSIEALAGALQRMVRDIDAVGGSSSLTLKALHAARAWLTREAPGHGTETSTLSAVRQALLQDGHAMKTVTEQQAAAHVWLPVYLLNLDRPRTPLQRQQAIERLDMIERRLLASRGGKAC